MSQQGAQANVSGNMLEGTVKTIFESKGFQVVRYHEWDKSKHRYGRELLLTNAPYTSIYSHRGTTEFLLLSERLSLEIRIECKWQQVSGSVDEKLPYLYLNCIEAMPEKHIIIIIDGEGWKQGAIEWLRSAVREKKYTTEHNRDKKIEVMNIMGFMSWANQVFRQAAKGDI